MQYYHKDTTPMNYKYRFRYLTILQIETISFMPFSILFNVKNVENNIKFLVLSMGKWKGLYIQETQKCYIWTRKAQK